MDTATALILLIGLALALAVAAVVVVRRSRARRAYRPAPSFSEDRTFVGIGATPPASDATMVGPMVQRPASARSEATVVDVRTASAPPPAPTAAASDAPTVVMGVPPADVTAPTLRVPRLRARLTVTKGGSGTHELEAREHTIGRSAHADIVIADPSVSGHHAKLSPRGDAFALSDLGSTNGTTVDGRAVHGEHLLRGGETIGIGDARLRYERSA